MLKNNLLLLLLIISASVFAQPFNLDTSINPVEIKLRPFKPTHKDSALQKGRMNIMRVTQVKDTLYYFVQGASIYSPVYVGVTSLDPANKIKVQLHKMNWQNASRSGTTNDKGQWSEKFKTENDFGIMVVPGSKPAKYSILVWVGDEPKMELPSVFSGDAQEEKKEEKGGKGGSGNTLLYVIIGVLAVAVGFLFFKMKIRRRNIHS
jgi:hypothetical protein